MWSNSTFDSLVARMAYVLVAFGRIVECSLGKLVDGAVAFLVGGEYYQDVTLNPACAEIQVVVRPIHHINAPGALGLHAGPASRQTQAYAEYA